MDKGLSDQIITLNNYKSRLSEASAENTYLRGKLDKYMAEITELKNQIPSPGHKDQLSFEKRRLSEELSIANKKLEVYAESGVGLVKELEEELENYKKLMKCNSCHIRDKNAVILKCMHCFCKNCLDIRLETRQRKCPNCGDAFGASDVKQIFL
jgi:E3 ubiquitin-protein ligase BRE1